MNIKYKKQHRFFKKNSVTFLFICLALPSLAVDFISTNLYATAKESTTRNEQWLLAEQADPQGTFLNDLNLATVSPLPLNGIYKGNVSVCSISGIVQTGTIDRNLRALGNTIEINGHVSGNIMALANTVIIGTNAVVHGDALILANNVVQEGTVLGDLQIKAQMATTLAGAIGGNATIKSPEIVLTKKTKITGNLTYQSASELFPDENCIAGALHRTFAPAPWSPAQLERIVIWFLAALLVGIPFITLFPMTVAMSTQVIRRSPWKCLLAGVLSATILPTLAMLCISSIIGLPLAGILIAFWAILLYLSRIVMALVIGTLILRSYNNSLPKILIAMILGLALLHITAIFPAIGAPVQLLSLWLGTGALVLTIIEKRRLIVQIPTNLEQLEKLRNKQNEGSNTP